MILQKVYPHFDEVILLDIYPARELPMEGITSTMVVG
jgi:UDP-N-acetylmuramate-alanine ligase